MYEAQDRVDTISEPEVIYKGISIEEGRQLSLGRKCGEAAGKKEKKRIMYRKMADEEEAAKKEGEGREGREQEETRSKRSREMTELPVFNPT